MNGKGKGEEEVQEEKGHRVREDIFFKKLCMVQKLEA